VYGFCDDGLIPSCRKAPVVLLYLLNRHPVAIGPLLTLGPLGQNVGDVVGSNWSPLIVEAESVGGQVVEPDGLSYRPGARR